MASPHVVDLSKKIEGSDSIEFREVQLAPDGVPFARVTYYLRGAEKEPLRLDMDKRVFLDHFEDDPEMEEFFARAARQIVDCVSNDLDMVANDSYPRDVL